MKRIGILISLAIALTFVLNVGRRSAAQTPTDKNEAPPIVGTWNVTSSQNGTPIAINVETFNLGGTMVHIDTGGQNSSETESIDLGVWKAIGDHSYSFKVENYIYTSGNLTNLAVGKCSVTLATPPNAFVGSCTPYFYTCSISECPGSLVFTGEPFQIVGKRF